MPRHHADCATPLSRPFQQSRFVLQKLYTAGRCPLSPITWHLPFGFVSQKLYTAARAPPRRDNGPEFCVSPVTWHLSLGFVPQKLYATLPHATSTDGNGLNHDACPPGRDGLLRPASGLRPASLGGRAWSSSPRPPYGRLAVLRALRELRGRCSLAVFRCRPVPYGRSCPVIFARWRIFSGHSGLYGLYGQVDPP